MLQLVMSVLINFFFPKPDLGFLIVTDDLQNILMKLFHIFVFFSFSDAFAQIVDLFEWLGNTGFESSAPSESTGNWRVVVVNGRTFIVTINQSFSFQENCLNTLEILLVHVK